MVVNQPLCFPVCLARCEYCRKFCFAESVYLEAISSPALIIGMKSIQEKLVGFEHVIGVSWSWLGGCLFGDG